MGETVARLGYIGVLLGTLVKLPTIARAASPLESAEPDGDISQVDAGGLTGIPSVPAHRSTRLPLPLPEPVPLSLLAPSRALSYRRK